MKKIRNIQNLLKTHSIQRKQFKIVSEKED